MKSKKSTPPKRFYIVDTYEEVTIDPRGFVKTLFVQTNQDEYPVYCARSESDSRLKRKWYHFRHMEHPVDGLYGYFAVSRKEMNALEAAMEVFESNNLPSPAER